VRVTNLDNGRSVVVRVNDRGPQRRDRILDVSSRAAQRLGFASAGLARVRIDPL
jgi:rare lipoprotein A